MLTYLNDLFYMHGHGIYVWSAYASVMVTLFALWWYPWRRWKNYLSTFDKNS